jgi:hypothetical protein
MDQEPSFPQDEKVAQTLEDHLQSRLQIERAAYEREWERHEQLGRLLASSGGQFSDFLKLATSLSSEHLDIDSQRAEIDGWLRAAQSSAAEGTASQWLNHLNSAGLENQLPLMHLGAANSGDRLTIRVPPYDVEWTSFTPNGISGVAQARGPGAYKAAGLMFGDLASSNGEPSASAGWMRAGTALGIWFKPKAANTYVRVAPLVDYNYLWYSMSSGRPSRNFCELCTRVQRYRGPGDFEILIDRRERLWDDRTEGFIAYHEGRDGGFLVNHDYFWGNSNDWYLVWVWCTSGIHFAKSGSSRAMQIWKVTVPWLVFEQWAMHEH